MLSALLASFVTSGKLFLVGGGTTPPEIVDRFIKECGGPSACILVLPLTSAEPEKSNGSEELLKKHGSTNTYVFNKSKPTPGELDELKKKLPEVKGVWIPGGQQGRVMERLGNDWVRENLRPLLGKGVHFYGTSAGAMLCSDPMIYGPGEEPDTTKTGPGIGLTTFVIDTHFAQRKREGRLRHALRSTGMRRGLGLNEREWIVIQDDKILEKHGQPFVLELDTELVLSRAGRYHWVPELAWAP